MQLNTRRKFGPVFHEGSSSLLLEQNQKATQLKPEHSCSWENARGTEKNTSWFQDTRHGGFQKPWFVGALFLYHIPYVIQQYILYHILRTIPCLDPYASCGVFGPSATAATCHAQSRRRTLWESTDKIRRT